ncbi:hypothetical protein FACS189427_08840 [Planctomycetales bacterium]|nr:hypothetical protein FACS189427_08840 [Planctomycetales bacterium]
MRENSIKLTLFAPQFDEICNIKKKLSYEKSGNKRARLAINRIENFQKDDLIMIAPITIDAAPGVYADPLIVKLFIKAAKKGQKCNFISDDKELRIRIREHLRKNAMDEFQIIELKEFDWDSIAALFDMTVQRDEQKIRRQPHHHSQHWLRR